MECLCGVSRRLQHRMCVPHWSLASLGQEERHVLRTCGALPQGTHMDHHGMASALTSPSFAFLQLVEGNDMLQSCSSRVGGFTKDSGSVCGGCRGLPAA